MNELTAPLMPLSRGAACAAPRGHPRAVRMQLLPTLRRAAAGSISRWTPRRGCPQVAAYVGGAVTRERYPDLDDSRPQPLAALRGGRRRPLGGAGTRGSATCRRPSARGRRSTSSIVERAARCRRRPAWRYRERPAAGATRARRAWAWPASRCSPAALSRPDAGAAAARRCRARWPRSTRDGARRRASR